MLVTPEGDVFLLVGSDGQQLGHDALREFIGEPITVRAELMRHGGSQLLKIIPAALHHKP